MQRAVRLGRLGLTLARARRGRRSATSAASRAAVAGALGDLRGLPQKIGQLISLRELDDETSAFAHLTDAAPAIPASQSFAWIERELGAPIGHVFRRLDAAGSAASLGQVHRGELHDGRRVAVKVQYPDIESSLETDLAALGWLAAPLSARRSAVNLDAYRAELRRALLDEIDYENELRALRRFADRAALVPGLVTPVPVDGLCTKRLITMTWVDGDRFASARAWPDEARREAALTLLRFFLRGVLEWHELHADPHPGNLRFANGTDGARVGVIDFGCVTRVSAVESAVFWKLASDGSSWSPSDLAAAYIQLGFDPDLLAPMVQRLPAVTRVLFEPFHRPGPYDVDGWQAAARLADALGDDRWNFRCAGPASLLFFIRAFMGVMQYTSRLGAVCDWRAELMALQPVARAENGSWASPGARTDSCLHTGARAMAAEVLKLSVMRNGTQIVGLSFAPSAMERLADLVPQELRSRLAERRIDVEALARKTVAEGCRPGEIFALDDGATVVRVWLE